MSQNIKFVLVETSHPGNIGAAARSIKNMGFADLTLVAPKSFPSPVATWRAANAIDVLESSTIVATLEEAIADCSLVFASSARMRRIPQPMLTPREAFSKLAVQNSAAKIAIVFGRENSGLNNQELALAHYHIHIPTNPDYPVLNLAQAVQIISYEFFISKNSETLTPKEFDIPASMQQMRHFMKHLKNMLETIGFLNPKHPGKLMQKLQRLFMRAKLEKNELAILRGILKSIIVYSNHMDIVKKTSEKINYEKQCNLP